MKQSLLSTPIHEILQEPYLYKEKYRLDQIFHFIYTKSIFDFNNMSNVPKKIKNQLDKKYSILNISLCKKQESKDQTIKCLFSLNDENYIESVILKDKTDRYTFCISTQSGCKMGCKYCMTGKMGFKKNLKSSEILSQILYLSSIVNKNYNIVFMGMGEPLDNYKNLVETITTLTTNKYNKISPSRITVSTCGIADKIEPLLNDCPGIRLAISFNSAIQSKRETIMPIAKKYPLNKLLDALYKCLDKYNKRISFEYVMIDDLNIGDDEIKALSQLKKKNKIHINLIPINNNNIGNFKTPTDKSVTSFYTKLKNIGFNVTKRIRKGEDIQADCGQLFFESLKQQKN